MNMKMYPIFKGGVILILLGLIIKVSVLLLDIQNYMFAGLAFTGIGIGMIGYSIYIDKLYIRN